MGGGGGGVVEKAVAWLIGLVLANNVNLCLCFVRMT